MKFIAIISLSLALPVLAKQLAVGKQTLLQQVVQLEMSALLGFGEWTHSLAEKLSGDNELVASYIRLLDYQREARFLGRADVKRFAQLLTASIDKFGGNIEILTASQYLLDLRDIRGQGIFEEIISERLNRQLELEKFLAITHHGFFMRRGDELARTHERDVDYVTDYVTEAFSLLKKDVDSIDRRLPGQLLKIDEILQETNEQNLIKAVSKYRNAFANLIESFAEHVKNNEIMSSLLNNQQRIDQVKLAVFRNDSVVIFLNDGITTRSNYYGAFELSDYITHVLEVGGGPAVPMPRRVAERNKEIMLNRLSVVGAMRINHDNSLPQIEALFHRYSNGELQDSREIKFLPHEYGKEQMFRWRAE